MAAEAIEGSTPQDGQSGEARRANPPMGRDVSGHPRCGRCAGRLFAEAGVPADGAQIVELGCVRCGARYYARLRRTGGGGE